MDEIGGSSRLTFGGLASGLDTGAIVDALIDVERQPLLRIQSERSSVQERQSLFRELSTLFLALRDAARGLDNLTDTLAAPSGSEEFLAYQAKSSDESVLLTTASDDATPGSYEVEVEAIAQSARRVSNGFAALDTPVAAGSGTLSIDFGGDDPIDVAVDATTTLQQIADAIEADENNDGSVRANLLFDGSEYRLIVSGTQVGLDNDVTVTSDFGAFMDAASTANQAADDARLTVFGLPITRSANEISDAIPGVTLDLLQPTSGPVDISVTRDDETIVERVQGLVDAYNAIRDFSLEQTTVDPTSSRAGPLSGNVTLRTLERQAQRVLGDLYSFGDNPFTSMGEVGIAFDSQGRLELDQSRLSEALDEDPLAVRELLSGDGTDGGVATSLAELLEPIVRTGDGSFALQDADFNDQIRRFDLRIEQFEERLGRREEDLLRRFSEMERIISALNAQAGFLSGLQG